MISIDAAGSQPESRGYYWCNCGERASVYEMSSAAAGIEMARPDPGLVVLRASQRAYLSARRPVEFLCSLVLFVLALPVVALLALLVTLDSPGSPFFTQKRVGKDGREFTIFKLRSMVVHAPAYSDKIAVEDPRVTRIGRFLRVSGLDELPQLLNVLTGDMNLIGPRPEMPFIASTYSDWEAQRLIVRPGVTGWWQVHHRNDEPMRPHTDFDIYYLESVGRQACQEMAVRTSSRRSSLEGVSDVCDVGRAGPTLSA